MLVVMHNKSTVVDWLLIRCKHVTVFDRWCLWCPAALLERQMVVFCPNIGVLSTVVLALVPLLRPYSWQSLLLPVLPTLEKMLDLLEAPVPFILGVQVRLQCRYCTRGSPVWCLGILSQFPDRASPFWFLGLHRKGSFATSKTGGGERLGGGGKSYNRPLFICNVHILRLV